MFTAPISAEDTLTIQVRARNSALAKAEMKGLSVADVSQEQNLIMFGIYRAPMFFGQRSNAEIAKIEAEQGRSAQLVAPKLSREFNDICVPLFI